jgi:hypothetical protein
LGSQEQARVNDVLWHPKPRLAVLVLVAMTKAEQKDVDEKLAEEAKLTGAAFGAMALTGSAGNRDLRGSGSVNVIPAIQPTVT